MSLEWKEPLEGDRVQMSRSVDNIQNHLGFSAWHWRWHWLCVLTQFISDKCIIVLQFHTSTTRGQQTLHMFLRGMIFFYLTSFFIKCLITIASVIITQIISIISITINHVITYLILNKFHHNLFESNLSHFVLFLLVSVYANTVNFCYFSFHNSSLK